jgi:mono/diheme cytochrome c family protein
MRLRITSAAFLAAAITCWTAGVLAQGQPAPVDAAKSDAAKKIPNPVKPTASSIAAGEKTYKSQCLACHGETGKGDGKAAANLNPKPSNLTDAEWAHGSTDGEIFTVIKDGVLRTPMKGYASKMTATEMWNVVNYVRSLSAVKGQ